MDNYLVYSITMNKPFAIIIQWPYWFGNFVGLAIWPFIFVKDKDDEKVLAHEYVHISQQLNHWLIWFYIRYFYQLFTKGYNNIDYEIEARELSK